MASNLPVGSDDPRFRGGVQTPPPPTQATLRKVSIRIPKKNMLPKPESLTKSTKKIKSPLASAVALGHVFFIVGVVEVAVQCKHHTSEV